MIQMSAKRTERLQEILSALKENGGKMGKKKLYNQVICWDQFTPETFERYLEALNASGHIKVPILTHFLADPIIELAPEKT